MIPTNELRFVERKIQVQTDWDASGYVIAAMKKPVRVLQQKWVNEELLSYDDAYSEWRDVPCVAEGS